MIKRFSLNKISVGSENNPRAALRMGAEQPIKEPNSVVKFLKGVGRRISSITPLPARRSTIPPEPILEEQKQRKFSREKLDLLTALVKSVAEQGPFWKTDIEQLFKTIEGIFDPEYGERDMYNQRCAVAIIATAQVLERRRNLAALKSVDGQKYLEWAALNMSLFDNIQRSAIDYLAKLKCQSSLEKIASPQNPDATGRNMAQKYF